MIGEKMNIIQSFSWAKFNPISIASQNLLKYYSVSEYEMFQVFYTLNLLTNDSVVGLNC